MKMLKYLTAIMIISYLSACNNDNFDDNANVNLYQTVWDGTLNEKISGKEYTLLVLFETDKVGHYRCKNVSGEEESFKNLHSFSYSLDNKILLINTNDGSILSGYWWIESITSKQIVLSTEPDSPYSSTIILTKVL